MHAPELRAADDDLIHPPLREPRGHSRNGVRNVHTKFDVRGGGGGRARAPSHSQRTRTRRRRVPHPFTHKVNPRATLPLSNGGG